MQFAAQHFLQPVRRKACELRVDVRENQVRGHDSIEASGDEFTEWDQIGGLNLREVTVIGRTLPMRVAFHKTVTGEMLANRRHALSAQALHNGGGERCGSARIAMESAMTDDRRFAIIKIKYWRETEVNADLAELVANR